MLPNRMLLSKNTEDYLRRLKNIIGITPNISSRLAFYRSIESGFRYEQNENDSKLDGTLILEKSIWLGELESITELLLKFIYPNIDDPKEMMRVWAAHVDDGIASLRNHKQLIDFIDAL